MNLQKAITKISWAITILQYADTPDELTPYEMQQLLHLLQEIRNELKVYVRQDISHITRAIVILKSADVPEGLTSFEMRNLLRLLQQIREDLLCMSSKHAKGFATIS